MASHHVLDFPSGFDLLPIIQFAFLHGCDIQEVPGCMVRLPLISEQVKGLFDIRYLLRIETKRKEGYYKVQECKWEYTGRISLIAMFVVTREGRIWSARKQNLVSDVVICKIKSYYCR